jgi:hypothetical protein
MRNSNAILSTLWLSNLQGAPEAKPTTLRSQVLLAFRIQWRTAMTKVKLLSAALIAAAMLATPAMAREGQTNSRHLAMDANASAASGARSIDERGCHPAPAVGAFATAPWVQPPCEPAR